MLGVHHLFGNNHPLSRLVNQCSKIGCTVAPCRGGSLLAQSTEQVVPLVTVYVQIQTAHWREMPKYAISHKNKSVGYAGAQTRNVQI
jgi:hypothetical protein